MALLDFVSPTPMAPGQRPSLHGELQFKASKWFYSFSFFFLVFDRNTQLGQLGGFVQQEQQVNGNQSCTASQGRLVAGRQCTLAACCPHLLLLLLCCQVQPCAGHSRRVQSLQLQESSSKRVKTIHTIELETLFLFPWDKWCKMWALVVVIVSVVWPIPPSDMTI